MKMLDHLPLDLVVEIATFLPGRDQISLSWCKRDYHKKLKQLIFRLFCERLYKYVPKHIFIEYECTLIGSTILSLMLEEDDFVASAIDLLCHIDNLALVQLSLAEDGWEQGGIYGMYVKNNIELCLLSSEHDRVRLNGPSCCCNWFDGSALFIGDTADTLGLTTEGKTMYVDHGLLTHVMFHHPDPDSMFCCRSLICSYLERGYRLALRCDNKKEQVNMVTMHDVLFGENY